jgi:hypothetical protein
VSTARQMTRKQIESLPPVITLATLARALGVSEPTIRQSCRSGELGRLGIKVNRIGVQHRVVTASLHTYLGLNCSASSVPPSSNGASQDKLPATPLRPVRGGGAA